MAFNDFFNETASGLEISVDNLAVPIVEALPNANSFELHSPIFFRAANTNDTGLYIAVGASGSRSWVFVGQTTPLRISRKAFVVPLTDQSTSISTTTSAFEFLMPNAFQVLNFYADVRTAPTGAPILVDINKNGTSIFGAQKIQIDISGTDSNSSSVSATLSTTNFAVRDRITFAIDQVGSTVAGTGLVAAIVGVYTD